MELTNIKPIDKDHGIFRCDVSGEFIGFPDVNLRSVAFKQFQSYKLNEQDDVSKRSENFRKEYELLRSFKNTEDNTAYLYIISAYLFETDYPDYGRVFLMELGDRSLYGMLKDTKISTGSDSGYTFSHCITFLRQICDALVYLHKGVEFRDEVKPIIHRDLKSPNILLFDGGRVCKLCDFGISRPVEVEMTAGRGTPAWMAPEIYSRRTKRYTVAADCYSFGLVVCELLFRTTPHIIGRNDDEEKDPEETKTETDTKVTFFSEKSKVLYLSKCTFSEYDTFKKKLPTLKDILSRLLSVKPGNRYTAEEVMRKLRGLYPQDLLDLQALYGPDKGRAVAIQQREATQGNIIEVPTDHMSSSPTVSVFFNVQKPEKGKFDEKDMEIMKQRLENRIDDLNTRASNDQTKPCTAIIGITISKEEATRLILEMKISQSKRDNVSIVHWCRQNQKDCTEFLRDFFKNCTTVGLQKLQFSMHDLDGYTADNELAEILENQLCIGN